MLPRSETCLERAGLLLALWGSEKGAAQWFPAFTARQAPGNARADEVSKHTLWLLAPGGGEEGVGGGERYRRCGEEECRSEGQSDTVDTILMWLEEKGQMWGRGGNRPPQAQKN